MSARTVSATKACTKCGETKPLDEFYRLRKDTDERHGWCSSCSNAASKARQAARRAEIGEAAYLAEKRDAQRRRRQKDRTYDRHYAKAKSRAYRALADRHRDEFESLLVAERERAAS